MQKKRMNTYHAPASVAPAKKRLTTRLISLRVNQ